MSAPGGTSSSSTGNNNNNNNNSTTGLAQVLAIPPPPLPTFPANQGPGGLSPPPTPSPPPPPSGPPPPLPPPSLSALHGFNQLQAAVFEWEANLTPFQWQRIYNSLPPHWQRHFRSHFWS